MSVGGIRPGVRFSPLEGEDELNHRVADELYRRGVQCLVAQQFRHAYEFFDNALEVLDYLNEETADCLGNVAYCAAETGRYDVAVQRAEQAAARFRELGRKGQEAKAVLTIGSVLQATDDLDAAIRTYREALALARDAQDVEVEASITSNIGAVLYQQGETVQAIEWQERALNLKRKYADPRTLATTLSNLAVAYRKRLAENNLSVCGYFSAVFSSQHLSLSSQYFGAGLRGHIV